jgi:hypothetical protein
MLAVCMTVCLRGGECCTHGGVQEGSVLTVQIEACLRLAGCDAAQRGRICVCSARGSLSLQCQQQWLVGSQCIECALPFLCSGHVQLTNLVGLLASMESQVGSVAYVLSVCCMVDQLLWSSECSFQWISCCEQ